jgi:hypothetical protein
MSNPSSSKRRRSSQTAAITGPGETRTSLTVTEDVSARQFRFMLPGPVWGEEDQARVFNLLRAAGKPGGYAVISGSQPPGVPGDFPALLAGAMAGMRVVLDTSGKPLTRVSVPFTARAALRTQVIPVVSQNKCFVHVDASRLSNRPDRCVVTLDLTQNGSPTGRSGAAEVVARSRSRACQLERWIFAKLDPNAHLDDQDQTSRTFQPTAEEVARIIHIPSRRGGSRRRRRHDQIPRNRTDRRACFPRRLRS